MKQEIYSPPNEGERYQNPWWLPILAVFLAASALLLGRFLADHYGKPALPKESVLAAQLQSEEGQDLLQLASDRNTYTLLLYFVSGRSRPPLTRVISPARKICGSSSPPQASPTKMGFP